MSNRVAPIALVAAVVGAGIFAIVRTQSAPAAAPESAAQTRAAEVPEPAAAPTAPPIDPNAPLPPNHPPIGGGMGGGAMGGGGGGADPSHGLPPADEEQASLKWTVPQSWASQPNPNRMRLATYKVSGSGGDAELTVSRAGGTVDANVQRWVGQFSNAGKETRAEKTVKGMKVTTVEVAGTYMGGMGSGGEHPGWSLRAAIVESKDSPYFFKLTGPSATVQASRAAFDKMIDGLTAQ